MFNFLEIKKLLSTKDKIYLNLKNNRNKKLKYPFYRNLKNILKGQLKNKLNSTQPLTNLAGGINVRAPPLPQETNPH